jgi:hypothetical protein
MRCLAVKPNFDLEDRMDTRLKLLALAFAAPLALAACEQEGAQVGEAEEPGTEQQAGQEEGTAGAEQETQTAPMPQQEPAGQ